MLNAHIQIKGMGRGWLVLTLAMAALVLTACKAAETGEEVISECADGSKACWAVIQPEILAGRGGCTGCHTGPSLTARGSLSWDYDKYTEIVTDGKPSKYPTGGLIVNKGSTAANESFLYRKLIGELAADKSEGDQMPLSGALLSSGDISLIAEWISKGSPEF